MDCCSTRLFYDYILKIYLYVFFYGIIVILMQDLYEIIGVSRSATEDEIKRSYRKLAQKYHPDRAHGDKAAEQKFKEVNAAYEILSDPQKRSRYDQFGATAGGGGDPDFSQFDFNQFGGGFADIFENFFGNGYGQRAEGRSKKMRGEDRGIEMTLSFRDAAFGIQKEVSMARVVTCPRCHGNGAEPNTKLITCDTCKGAGELTHVRATFLGQIHTRSVCGRCHGEGRIAETPCTHCKGQMHVERSEKITIRIPAGVEDGAVLRVNGKGDEGVGGMAGNLYVTLHVQTDPKFTREGATIHSEEEIHVVHAVLGTEITVETIHGPVRLKIPAGTQSGKIFRLKEYGIPKLQSAGSRGDHYVHLTVKIPQKLSRKEREMYEALMVEGGLKKTPENESFLKKILS